MRRLRSIFIAAGFAAGLPIAANALPQDFQAAHAEGAWTGCVEQTGYAPYPVRLEPLKSGQFRVIYPKLCQGLHRLDVDPDYDAIETIAAPLSTCVTPVRVNYSHVEGELKLNYTWANAFSATAQLRPGQKTALCDPSKAVS